MSEPPLSTSIDTSATPERFDPATMHGELIEAEHLARYRWVSSLAQKRRVLDAGCGTAYGSLLLAEAGALEVTGVDRAPEALAAAREKMPATVVLDEADVTALPYEDGRFDLVVCFEVIEHLEDPGRALDEFRRVLAPGGVVAVSSPNRDVYPPGNPHHVHEYTPDELEQQLSSRFAFTSIDRQHTWISSGVLDDKQFRLGGDVALATSVSIRKLIVDEPGSELYTIALAGQSELPEASGVFELTTPVELRKWDALWHEQAELLTAHEQVFAEHAIVTGQLQREMDQLRNQLAKTESELARMPELDAQLRELLQVNDELLSLNHELQRRQEHLQAHEEIAARYTVLVESLSWRMTAPLRRIGALVRGLTR